MQDTVQKVGRELDIQIAERLMGWREWTAGNGFKILFSPEDFARCDTDDPPMYSEAPGRNQLVPLYSTDMRAAWEVFVASVERFGTVSTYGDMEEWSDVHPVVVGIEGGDYVITVRWKPFPLAMCEAAIAALDALNELESSTPVAGGSDSQ